MAGETGLTFCELREAAGLSLEQAAKRLRTSINRALKFENGLDQLTARQRQILSQLRVASKKLKPQKASFTHYDFFAGCGMSSVGLGPDWHCTFANDIDAMKASAYRAYHGDESLVVKDVRRVTTSDLPGTADLAWASFPCQDLSLAGNGAGLKSQRSGLFFSFWHLIRALHHEQRAPRTIVLENVTGLLTSNGGRDFGTIASAFSGRDYQFGALVVDAVHFVPQSRPRVFIIGVHKDAKISPSLVSQGPSSIWHPKALREAHNFLSKAAASKWIWWNLPSPPRREKSLTDLIESAPTGIEWHSPAETEYLLNLMDSVNRAKVEAAKKVTTRVIGTIYRRMRPNGKVGRVQRAEVRFDNVAGCLRTPNGGSSRQTLLIVEGEDVRSRLLSPREAARLMGLPDKFPLPERYNDAYHLAGDGVVAPVVSYLARQIIEPLLTSPAAAQNSCLSRLSFAAA